MPKPEINNLIQNRLTEKNFLNDINIQTTQYVSIKHIDELKENENFLPGLLKTTTLGYDGKGQYKLNSKTHYFIFMILNSFICIFNSF